MAQVNGEPADYHGYGLVTFRRETFEFYLAATKFYESLLEENLNELKNDADLWTILGEGQIETFPIGKEFDRVRGLRERFEFHLQPSKREEPDFDVSVSHGWVRYIKSIAILYLNHLRKRRDAFARGHQVPTGLLQALDQQISSLEEKVTIGVFRNATPSPLILGEIREPAAEDPADVGVGAISVVIQPKPLLLDSIEIRDTDIRDRCLDLFAQFREDGAHDRLDTVVNEATRILEDRMRSLASAPETCTGVDLAKYCFAAPQPRLTVSEVPAEQEAAHLLYRGVFGYIRNSVHHRLVGDLQPERVLQIVGMIDYLISVVESARRCESTATGGADIDF